MEFKNIGEFDNFVVSCTEEKDFEEIMKDDLFLNNKALQINFVNNPLAPEELVGKLYMITKFNEVKQIIQKRMI